MKDQESLYSKLAPNYHEDGDYKKIDKKYAKGYTLLLPRLPKTKNEKEKYKELIDKADNYSNEFLCRHTVLGKYSIEELAEKGSVDTACGYHLEFKTYKDPIDGNAYTVNGVAVDKDNVSLSENVYGYYIKEPVWLPPGKPSDNSEYAKRKNDDPMTNEIAQIFSKVTRIPPMAFIPFLDRFKSFSELEGLPFTFMKPRNYTIQNWAKAFQFAGPASFPVILNQFCKYVIPGMFGPADFMHADSVKNLAGEDVPITSYGDNFLKYKDVVFNPEEALKVDDGKGFIYKNEPPPKDPIKNYGQMFG